ncbi:MAG: hypothetical protein ACT443_11500, partial [Gemmatimonadota bacterium]
DDHAFAPPGTSPKVTVTAFALPVKTYDDVLAEVADQYHEFGGFYQNSDQTFTFVLTDETRAPEIRTEIARRLDNDRILSSPYRVARAAYNYRQLQDWRIGVNGAVTLVHTTSLDIDETRNVIVVGVSNPADAVLVKSQLSFIPADALVVVQRDPFITGATLSDAVRGTIGGLKISAPAGNCTMGFNATYQGRRSFGTNDHCTSSWGGGVGSTFGQPSSSFFVGTEYASRTWYNNSTNPACPAGELCRYEDLTVAEYDSNVGSVQGSIAHTTRRASATASDTISSQVFMTVNGELLWPLLNDVVDKVGYKTGWTFGLVSETCVDKVVFDAFHGATRRFLCTYVANGGWDHGDSGSAVFFWDGGTNAKITGQLLGGNPNLQQFFFSSWNNIQSQFGEIETCYVGFVC